MRNDEQNRQGDVPRPGRSNGLISNSIRSVSGYFKIVSSSASTVVKSAASAASAAIVDKDNVTTNDQVYWAGFDKLEYEGIAARRVLLLGYRFGFQVWDVEEANNVHEIICRCHGPVSFMQILPKLIASKQSADKFADSCPLLAVCADGSFNGDGYVQDGSSIPCNGNIQTFRDQFSGGFLPTAVWFFSLNSQSYVHVLKFRSVVFSVRCSSLVVAVLQAAQIHCFDAATLERDYTILTNPIVTSGFVSGTIGLGPLAVGPRWMAYSGPPVAVSSSGRVNPQHLTPSGSFPSPPSNGSLVAHYAKESSKQLAAGIVTLGDIGYKKLSRYYFEMLPDGNNGQQLGTSSPGWKNWGSDNGHLPDEENIGMVIVRDVVGKSVIAQFRAHKSPISSLCFDPSGTLLVTASVQGHNINVYRIMPKLSESSSGSDSVASYVHLYRLQRGYTNAVIADISFSDDSYWIMISSSRGTGHLFAISPSGGNVNFPYSHACFTIKNSELTDIITKTAARSSSSSGLQMLNQQKLCESGPPVALSPVSRIRSGGWRNTVTGAAAAATGRMGSFCGVISSAFHSCKNNDLCADTSYLKAKYHLLLFNPSGCVIQYALRIPSLLDGVASGPVLSPTYDSAPESDARLMVEAIQKWNICQKQSQRERENNFDIYGENGNTDSRKIYPEEMSEEVAVFPEVKDPVTKVKISPEERHHMHISEAELQMHLSHAPLWDRSEIYFHTMFKDGTHLNEEDVSEGETLIENIPVHMMEARSKDLVPVFEYLKMPKIQTARRTSATLDAMDGKSAVMGKHKNGTEKLGFGGLQIEGFVNNNESPRSNTRLEFVNNRNSSVTETPQKFVNNYVGGQEMETQFGGDSVEFD